MESTNDRNTTTSSTSSTSDDRPTYTIADLGLRTTQQTHQTIIGPTRSLYSLTRFEWLYISISVVSLLVSMAMAIERLLSLSTNTSDYTFAFLLFWTICFSFIYVLQGVFRERTFELLAFVATIAIVLFYVIINYFNPNSPKNDIKFVRLVITVIFCPILIICGLKLSHNYFKSKNLIFRTVGANVQLQKMCEMLFLGESLLKFDAQLAGTAVILWLRKGFHDWGTIDKIVVSIGSVITISWLTLGLFAIRCENKAMVYVFLLTSIFEPTIIIWDLIRYSLGPDDMALEVSVFLTGIIALIVRVVTVVVMVLIWFNFNKGLKRLVYGAQGGEGGGGDASISEPIVSQNV